MNNTNQTNQILQGDSIEVLTCVYCGKEFTRAKSRRPAKQPTCSRKHREAGMIEGIIKVREGTGYGVDDILRRRKYYKYKQFDSARSLPTLTITVREFCKELSAATCHYCGSTKDVGLDRKDNSLGHSSDNTVWACSLCNMTRGNRFSVEQMEQIGQVIRSFYE